MAGYLHASGQHVAATVRQRSRRAHSLSARCHTPCFGFPCFSGDDASAVRLQAVCRITSEAMFPSARRRGGSSWTPPLSTNWRARLHAWRRWRGIYVGAVASALASMVGNLTVGKKTYAAVEDDVRATLERLALLRNKLLALIESDARRRSSRWPRRTACRRPRPRGGGEASGAAAGAGTRVRCAADHHAHVRRGHRPCRFPRA